MTRAVLLALLLTSSAQAAVGVVAVDGAAAGDPAVRAAGTALGVDAQPLALPVDAAIVAGATLEPCAGTPVAVERTLTEAKDQLNRLQTSGALLVLSTLSQSLPCADTALTDEQIASVFELAAQAAQDEGQDDVARTAYESLLVMDPARQLEAPPGTGYEDLFVEVRPLVNARTPHSLAVRSTPGLRLNGVELDGASPSSLRVVPGRHLVQWGEGEELRGAWLLIEGDAALISQGVARHVLAEGPTSTASTDALIAWLTAAASEQGVDGVAVVHSDDGGYVVSGGELQRWRTAAAAVEAPTAAPDRVRIAFGGGYGTVDSFHYGELLAALDVRLVGPLHLRVDGGAGFSGVDVGDESLGTVAVLPGVGAGVALHPIQGVAQPYGALTLGVFITPTTDATLAARATFDDENAVQDRGPVGFRGYLDGGLDLVPHKALGVRLGGGVGYGLGFLARGYVQVLVRM